MTNETRRSLLVLLAALLAACGSEGKSPLPTPVTDAPRPSAAPSPQTSAEPSSQQLVPLRIVSGGDASPVSGATVTINGVAYKTDDRGEIAEPEMGLPVQALVDVEAPGFLLRRTRLNYRRYIYLWPVASPAEAEAVRRMVYDRDGLGQQPLHPPDAGPFLITVLEDAGGLWDLRTQALWQETADAFGRPFGIGYALSTGFQYETNEIALHLGSSATCQPVPAWGFCRASSGYKTFDVSAAAARDPRGIRRVLAAWFLGANPLPGLMSAAAPADELSALEEQAIRMILLHDRPTRWPDDDR